MVTNSDIVPFSLLRILTLGIACSMYALITYSAHKTRRKTLNDEDFLSIHETSNSDDHQTYDMEQVNKISMAIRRARQEAANQQQKVAQSHVGMGGHGKGSIPFANSKGQSQMRGGFYILPGAAGAKELRGSGGTKHSKLPNALLFSDGDAGFGDSNKIRSISDDDDPDTDGPTDNSTVLSSSDAGSGVASELTDSTRQESYMQGVTAPTGAVETATVTSSAAAAAVASDDAEQTGVREPISTTVVAAAGPPAAAAQGSPEDSAVDTTHMQQQAEPRVGEESTTPPSTEAVTAAAQAVIAQAFDAAKVREGTNSGVVSTMIEQMQGQGDSDSNNVEMPDLSSSLEGSEMCMGVPRAGTQAEAGAHPTFISFDQPLDALSDETLLALSLLRKHLEPVDNIRNTRAGWDTRESPTYRSRAAYEEPPRKRQAGARIENDRMFGSQLSLGGTPIANLSPPPANVGGGRAHTPHLPKFAHDVVVGNEMKPSAVRSATSHHARGAVAKVAREKAISEKIMENISSGINHMGKVECEVLHGTGVYKKAGSGAGQPSGLEWTHSDSMLAQVREASAAFVVSPRTAFDDRSVDSLSSTRSIQSQTSSCASPRARSGSLLSADVDVPMMGGLSITKAEVEKRPIVRSSSNVSALSGNDSNGSLNGLFETGPRGPLREEEVVQRKRETPAPRRASSNLTSALAACAAHEKAGSDCTCVDSVTTGCDNDKDKVKLVPHPSASPSLEKAVEKTDSKRSKPIAIAGRKKSKEEASSSAPAEINIERTHAKIKGRRPSASKQQEDDPLNQSLDERNSEVAEIMATAAADMQLGGSGDGEDGEDGEGEDPEISMINN